MKERETVKPYSMRKFGKQYFLYFVHFLALAKSNNELQHKVG